jgi:hypothetical protein
MASLRVKLAHSNGTADVRSGSIATDPAGPVCHSMSASFLNDRIAAWRRNDGMGHQRKWPTSFDHFVGAAEQRCWEIQPECLGGFQVDDERNFCHLLNWQVGRSSALENLAGVDALLAIDVNQIGSVAHQAAGVDEVAYSIDGWHRVAGRQANDLAPTIGQKRVDADDERGGAQLDKGAKRCVDLAFGAGIQNVQVQAE